LSTQVGPAERVGRRLDTHPAADFADRGHLPDNGPVDSIPQTALDLLRERLATRPEILEAYCFGSRARGDAEAHSDLDIAVYIDRDRVPSVPFGYAAGLTAELMAGLGADALDVVVLNDAPPLLYHRVLRDGERLLSRDLAATTSREGRALSRYCDYQQQLRKVDRELARRLADGTFGR
ncbi:MAG: type VII toxin-antitoxin system MntA family adenylyltransferase antitoxin, partial [Candidatus Rokuibacteriota bacterium]